MLITEWNDDEYREVMKEEGREEGLEEGLERGLERGREEGALARALEIARNMKAEGLPAETIELITGISEETISSNHKPNN